MRFVLILTALATLVWGGPPRFRCSPFQRGPGRIMGGEVVDIHNYPYQVSLQYFGRHGCGAVIISERFVVTAAHCLTDVPATVVITVRAGSSIKEQGGHEIPVANMFIHPLYDSNIQDYDVGLVETELDMPLGRGVRPVNLPDGGEDIGAGAQAHVSGWGQREGGQQDEHLRAVAVQIVSNEDCAIAYGQYAITDRMTCAGAPGGGKDACQGDSGGPLVVEGELVGLVSWGYGCGSADYPGVYSRIAAVRPFIKEIAGV